MAIALLRNNMSSAKPDANAGQRRDARKAPKRRPADESSVLVSDGVRSCA